ncbi:hypothetical protein RDV89_05995 [Nocardioides zeae]|uniref:Uncharacterized protein n=1 Tax=Nocardioides imazamoxiresistens TaxID=3231893 RepID=A0ABU3PTQ5_9ACTN|nr:hypothetical protein [Nocardioides zeae]MDT9592607.1 hypothetical protein [Nocardioides zeae]
MSSPLDLPGLRGRLGDQGGVVARAHLLMHGATPARLRVWVWVARRDLCAVQPGIARIGRLLRLHGWRGTPRPCGPGCAVAGAEAA